VGVIVTVGENVAGTCVNVLVGGMEVNVGVAVLVFVGI